MHERHIDRKKYFEEQTYTTERYVIPYINHLMPITSQLAIAEIGCGEGGNLMPFLSLGCRVTGIDIADNKIANAKKFFEHHPLKKNLTLITGDICKITPERHLNFDLIVMRDTLEHIPNQCLLLEHLKKFIKPDGKIFLAFPPWRMPFGGHQQMCESKLLSVIPYFHLLPNTLYIKILKSFGESEAKIKGLLEVKGTGISSQKFKQIIKKNSYKIEKETLYLINPNYEIKFNLKPRTLPRILNIPYLRDFFTATYYCIISIPKN